MSDPKTGAPTLKYAGVSRQKRACRLLFDDPSAATISQVHPVVEDIECGRPQHSFWSVHRENVLLLQRIAAHRRGNLGSYNTGKFGMRFEGADLQKVEEDGWIFATNGKAYVGVKFMDGAYRWDDKREEVFPANQPEFLPTRQGFERYFGVPHSNDMQRKCFESGDWVVPLLRHDKVAELLSDERQGRIVERYAVEAVRFITENACNRRSASVPADGRAALRP